MTGVVFGEFDRDYDPDVNFFDGCFGEVGGSVRSLYTSVDRFNSIPGTARLFTVMGMNIRSFNANFDAFEGFLQSLSCKPNIIALTETWMSQRNSAVCEIPGYRSCHTFRSNRAGGGASVFIAGDVDFRKIENMSICNETIETCAVELPGVEGDKSLIVLTVYRPHTDSVVSFTDFLIQVLHSEVLHGKKVVLIGDFNINLLNIHDSSVQYFVSSMRGLSYVPMINQPTRFSLNNDVKPSITDHIWYNSLEKCNSGIFFENLTDHCPIFIQLYRKLETVGKIKFVFRSLNLEKIAIFRKSLMKIDLDLDCEFDACVSGFIGKLNECYCDTFPLVTKYISQKRLLKPWLSSHVMRQIREKSRMFKQWKLGMVDFECYKKYRNKVNSAIRYAKNIYFKNSFENSRRDIRNSWKVIRNILGQKKKSTVIKCLSVDGEKIEDEQGISDSFGEYFATIACELEEQIPPSFESPLRYVEGNLMNSMYLKPVTIRECVELIKSLRITKYDVNSITVSLLKEMSDILAPPLTALINRSFELGVFPESLKSATVVPVFKKGDPELVKNYRPISILPLFSKVFERAMCVRLLNFCSEFSIFSEKQFGFRRGLSSQDALLDFINYIYEGLDKRQHVVSVLIDLSKAFDTVDHAILIEKLNAYGIRGLSQKWIANYLSNRTQRVRVNNSFSPKRGVSLGVPQGSLLGPILFLLYVNDITNVSSSVSFVLYADDTTVSFRHEDPGTLISTLNDELDKIYKWSICNRLSINADKTKSILFTNRNRNFFNDRKLVLNGLDIEYEDSCELLGLIIDSRLTFGEHTSHVCNKVSKTVGNFYKLRACVSTDEMIMLYHGMFYPYIIYCCLVWGGAAGVHFGLLEIIQKRLVRIMAGESYLAHTRPIFKNLSILKIREIYSYQVGIRAFKQNGRGLMPVAQHSHFTRNSGDALVNFRRLNKTQRSLDYLAPTLWNSIPENIKNNTSLLKFKCDFKKYLLEFGNEFHVGK